MSDTTQMVTWHLAYECPFRKGAAVENGDAAVMATWELRRLNTATAGASVYGDICVTSVSYSEDGRWPGGGFRISDTVKPVGSLDAARRVCGQCPANAFPTGKGQLAGCCGHLQESDLSDAEADRLLLAAIEKANLREELTQAFEVIAKPLWLTFWIPGTLSPRQIKFLSKLPNRLLDSNWGGIGQFNRACTLALKHGLKLKVEYQPPGHADFGWVTTFAHCPQCKTRTGERWETPSSEAVICKSCGFSFIPAETKGSIEYDEEEEELEQTLAPQEFEALRNAWLAEHAADPHPKELMRAYALGEEQPAGKASWFARLWKWLRG